MNAHDKSPRDDCDIDTIHPSPQQQKSNEDWTCSDCNNVNFARRKCCNRCSKPRPVPLNNSNRKRKLGHEIGKAAAEKSRGLFSADDWQCTKCGNVNWARRQHCNVCNAPKFGDVEERTGFGGGYNDREVVEYKERKSDSDDEYDEFGRRKRTRTSSGNRSESLNEDTNSPTTDNKECKRGIEGNEDDEDDEEENDDDDDDDDDDDEDLSKYDLSNV